MEFIKSSFLSTLSLRRATCGCCARFQFWAYFYPRSPCGERLVYRRGFEVCRYFYPRSPCGERRVYVIYNMYNNTISIHALLAESDLTFNTIIRPSYAISIHALLAESDLYFYYSGCATNVFLSTLSLRRATETGEVMLVDQITISIHALLAESDLGMPPGRPFFPNFYPRSPCGERRGRSAEPDSCFLISIHALLAESDQGAELAFYIDGDFYPRSPCGERRYMSMARCH